MKTEGTKIKSLAVLMATFIAAPWILVLSGFYYVDCQKAIALQNDNVRKIKGLFQYLELYRDTETFVAKRFQQTIMAAEYHLPNLENELIARVNELRQSYKCEYILYFANLTTEKIARASFKPDKPRLWVLALRALKKKISDRQAVLSEQELRAVGEIFGPQLNWFTICDSYSSSTAGFVHTDSQRKKPLMWPIPISDYVLLILLDQSELKNNDGLENELKQLSKGKNAEILFSMCENKSFRHISVPEKYKKQIENAKFEFESTQRARIETQDLIIFNKLVKNGLTISLALIKKPMRLNLAVKWRLALMAFLAVFSFLLCRYFYRVALKPESDNASIKLKLFVLFLFANLMPLFVLFCLGTDYLGQKRNNLLLEKQSEIIKTLQTLDEKMQFEYARLNAKSRKAGENFAARVIGQSLNNNLLWQLNNELGFDENWRVIAVATAGTAVGTEAGLYDSAKKIIPPGFGESSKREECEFFRSLGQVFLALLNHENTNDQTALELEIAVESIAQRPISELMTHMLKNIGEFANMGISTNVHPAIAQIVYKKNLEKSEYLLFTIKHRQKFQFDFLRKHLPRANRNNRQVRVVALNKRRFDIPPGIGRNTEILKYSETLTPYPADDISFLTYETKTHLACGLIGHYAAEYRLIGLCPLEVIDKIIAEQKKLLYIFAVLSLMMTVCLSIALAESFIIPLNRLMQGAAAIESKMFSLRLPSLGSDEFGALGSVFNDVMVSLEELSVASAIQMQLLPHSEIETPGLGVFGKSVPMTDLGGDYFDYFEVSQDSFGVLLGDAAGHGVGAALIMAMTKAAVLQSDDILRQPIELINRLHKLILASRTKKQRRIMTLQYMCLNRGTNRARYSNAGGCFPIIIRNGGTTAEELSLEGPVLGGFKKAVYSETEVCFEKGDAVVFYSDGLVEALNPKGMPLGYNGLKEICLKSYNTNAEQFYRNIYDSYLAHLKGQKPQDDVTLVVLVCDSSPKPQC